MGDQWAWPHQAKRGHRAQVSPRRGPAGPGQVRYQGPTVAENQIRFFPDVQITRLPYQRCLEGVPTYQTHWGCPGGSGAWQPHGAWNTKQQILIGTLGFLVNTATQASIDSRDKHRSRMPWGCKTPSQGQTGATPD